MLILTNDASLTLEPNQSVTFNLEILRTCCCGPETLTIVNNGETTVVVEQPLLKIKRVA